MKQLPPYKIDVFNMAGQSDVGSYYSNQVPRAGDLIAFGGSMPQDNPFRSQLLWRVETVMWQMAEKGSQSAIALERQADGFPSAYCAWVELLVWPASGPHFHKRPEWAPRDDEEEDIEEADIP